jgi:hypothetical protein
MFSFPEINIVFGRDNGVKTIIAPCKLKYNQNILIGIQRFIQRQSL